MFAPAAFADEIGDAAKKLGDGSYDFAKEVDWNYGLYLQAPGAFKPLEALKAIDKMIVMGAAADPEAGNFTEVQAAITVRQMVPAMFYVQGKRSVPQ